MTEIVVLPHADICPEGKTFDATKGMSLLDNLLEQGIDSFLIRAELAARAERTLDAEYFIFRNDETGKLLVEALTEAAPTKRVLYLPRNHDVVQFLASEVRPGDVVLTLGAGDITMVADEVLEGILEASK